MNCWKNITTSEVKSALVIKKVFEGKIDTKFHGNAITISLYLSIGNINSVLKMGKNYH